MAVAAISASAKAPFRLVLHACTGPSWLDKCAKTREFVTIFAPNSCWFGTRRWVSYGLIFCSIPRHELWHVQVVLGLPTPKATGVGESGISMLAPGRSARHR